MTESIPLPDHPFGREIDFAAIKTLLQRAVHWEERYREVIRLSRKMPALPSSYLNAEHEISGCENRVWLVSARHHDGTMHFVIESESRIVKGLLAILLTQCEGLSPQQIVERDLLAAFSELALTPNLSATRQAGLAAVAQAITTTAERLLTQA